MKKIKLSILFMIVMSTINAQEIILTKSNLKYLSADQQSAEIYQLTGQKSNNQFGIIQSKEYRIEDFFNRKLFFKQVRPNSYFKKHLHSDYSLIDDIYAKSPGEDIQSMSIQNIFEDQTTGISYAISKFQTIFDDKSDMVESFTKSEKIEKSIQLLQKLGYKTRYDENSRSWMFSTKYYHVKIIPSIADILEDDMQTFSKLDSRYLAYSTEVKKLPKLTLQLQYYLRLYKIKKQTLPITIINSWENVIRTAIQVNQKMVENDDQTNSFFYLKNEYELETSSIIINFTEALQLSRYYLSL